LIVEHEQQRQQPYLPTEAELKHELVRMKVQSLLLQDANEK